MGWLCAAVTLDLILRIGRHRTRKRRGYASRYRAGLLVWYELHGTMESAIAREKRIKGWRRIWKLRLIEQANPLWMDRHDEIVEPAEPG